MNRFLHREIILIGGLMLSSSALGAGTFPFVVDTEDGQWKQAVIQKLLAPDVGF